jgi:hypothetical protein
VCRALKVLCLAEDVAALAELKRAAVSADWELTAGATDEEEAMRQLHDERPHVVVAFGPFEGFAERALEAYPYLRIVADRDLPGATAIATSPQAIRDAVRERRPGGPIR